MGLIDVVRDKKVCIDTAPFIYYIEHHEQYLKVIDPVFKSIDSGEITAITTNITLLEVLVHPYKRGDEEVAGQYKNILLDAEGLTTYEISHELSENAARIRAVYNIRTPDAIQISAGILYGANIMITNDSDLKRVSEIKVVCLPHQDPCGR